MNFKKDQRVALACEGFAGEVVKIIGPYTAMGAWPDEYVVLRSTGDTMAVRDRDIRELPTEQELEDFAAGMIECAIWADLILPCPDCEGKGCSSCDGVGSGKEFGAGNDWPDYTDEVSSESKALILSECRDFITSNLADLREYCEMMGDWSGDDGSNPAAMARAGHDFWLTRHGHGTGFWDRCLGELGDRLSEASKPYGSAYPWYDPNTETITFEGI